MIGPTTGPQDISIRPVASPSGRSRTRTSGGSDGNGNRGGGASSRVNSISLQINWSVRLAACCHGSVQFVHLYCAALTA